MYTRWATIFALACMAAPVAAQNKAETAKDKPDADKLICRSSGETGSRLGGRRECHTKAEWDQIRMDNTEALRRATSANPR